MKIAIRIIVSLLVIAAVGGYVGYKQMTGGLFAKAYAGPEIGEKMPDFTLTDYNDKKHSLKKYIEDEDVKAIVLEMCSIECPWSRGADEDLVKLHKEYKDKGVVFLGIDSHKSTTLGEIRDYAKENEKYPVLKDVNNEYADKVGAKVTPEIYVLDSEGKLRYHGAFDDRVAPEGDPENPYTKQAIEAVLAGEEPETKETTAWGCSIKRAK